jgi:hypothetical protein
MWLGLLLLQFQLLLLPPWLLLLLEQPEQLAMLLQGPA